MCRVYHYLLAFLLIILVIWSPCFLLPPVLLHVQVRGISGGERKRTSVACGLLARPLVIFMDEPTSGAKTGGPFFRPAGHRHAPPGSGECRIIYAAVSDAAA